MSDIKSQSLADVGPEIVADVEEIETDLKTTPVMPKRKLIVRIIFMILRIITLGFFKPKPVVVTPPVTSTP